VPIRCFAVSVIALRRNDEATRVLLLRRTGGPIEGEWCQVAGGIEPGEVAWRAALRELKEETGLVPERFYSADICEQFYEPDKECISLLPVFVAYIGTEAMVTLNHEHSDFRWMSFDEARAAVPFSGQRAVLDHVEREFVQARPTEWLRIDF
jgi:dATP pyrophosphohydrolase